MSLGEACLRLMDRSPNRIVQISADTGINYTNLDIQKRAIRTAKFLQQQGLQQGDIFGIIARNSANMAPIAVAGFMTGMPFNALDAFCIKSDIVHMYGITKPKIIFCDEICYETVRSALDELNLSAKIYFVDGRVQDVSHVVDFMEAADDSWIDFVCPVLENPSKFPAVIMNSSGTTGLPKAASEIHQLRGYFSQLYSTLLALPVYELHFRCPVLENPSKLPAVIMNSSGTTGLPKAASEIHQLRGYFSQLYSTLLALGCLEFGCRIAE